MNYHYYNINVKVTIKEVIVFNVVTAIRIESTTSNFSDIATIELPREFKNARKAGKGISLAQKKLVDYIKPGDAVKIEASYNDEKLATEFTGYITEVGAEIPLVIKCEDEMYWFKKKPKFNKAFKSVNLKELLQYMAPEYEVQALDMPLGKFTVSHATPYKVIEELKAKFGVRCYFKGKKLYTGLAIDFKPNKTHTFVFGRNIRNTNNLKYVTKEQRKRYYKGISHQSGSSKKVIYEFGDPDGDNRTLHLPLNLSLDEVKDWVHRTYEDTVFNGYEGSLNSWGIPKTEVGDTAKIIDPNYKDKHRDMTLYIESVVTTIDQTDGFKRENKLSFKID